MKIAVKPAMSRTIGRNQVDIKPHAVAIGIRTSVEPRKGMDTSAGHADDEEKIPPGNIDISRVIVGSGSGSGEATEAHPRALGKS